ncbi:hypothetical protein FKP32DRAFT_1596885 [Trametes sanguinea]|nr:hypothetical protein FKP32DRAFT_1596885 [Trametes sanguinea]
MSLIRRALFSRQLFRIPHASIIPRARLVHVDATSTWQHFLKTYARCFTKKAARYLPFNVQALIDVATKAAAASECTSIEKLQDGTFNRVLALRFDNDVELIAKLPFPVAGPKHLCTASEVATLDYLRTEVGIPVPIVRAWCSRAESSPVGIEYILYEKIPGVPLRQLDNADLPLKEDPFMDVLMPIVTIESCLNSAYFSQIGSIYYKEDVAEPLQTRPLYPDWFMSEPNSERFRIGPTVDREFWRAGRAALDIDRGPWPDVKSWMLALANCARASIANHPDEGFKAEYERLIAEYETLVPHIAPSEARLMLWHPDLYPRNIIVSETRPRRLNGIIDWQNAVVALYCFQLSIPPAYDFEGHPMVVYPEDGKKRPVLAKGIDQLDDKAKRKALIALRRAERKRVHELTLRATDPKLAKSLYAWNGAAAFAAYARPAAAITHGSEGLFVVPHSFLECRALHPFPLDISDAEAERVEQQWAQATRQLEEDEAIMRECGGDPETEGSVGVEEYDAVKRALDDAKARALAAASTPEERERIDRDWRWQDGQRSLSAELCC